MTDDNLKRLGKKMLDCCLRGVKCCANCAWREDDVVNDFNYEQWCGNPGNEDLEAKPGETAHFSVSDFQVCDRWDPVTKKQEN